jgi:hypothetical protein
MLRDCPVQVGQPAKGQMDYFIPVTYISGVVRVIYPFYIISTINVISVTHITTIVIIINASNNAGIFVVNNVTGVTYVANVL